MDALPSFDHECFVISPIGPADSEVRRRADGVLSAIIEPAVGPLNLVPVRADRISESGHITTQVIEHVLKAAAIVADLSDHNPNVFYELAVAHAFSRPVVQIIEP